MSQKQNIVIEAGATFVQTYTLTDSSNNAISTNGYSVSAQMRQSYYSINSVSFSANLNSNVLTLQMSANTTQSILPGRYVYDVLLSKADGTKERIIEGVATVTPEVTKS